MRRNGGIRRKMGQIWEAFMNLDHIIDTLHAQSLPLITEKKLFHFSLSTQIKTMKENFFYGASFRESAICWSAFEIREMAEWKRWASSLIFIFHSDTLQMVTAEKEYFFHIYLGKINENSFFSALNLDVVPMKHEWRKWMKILWRAWFESRNDDDIMRKENNEESLSLIRHSLIFVFTLCA